MASTSVRDSVQAFLTSEEPACSSQIPSELAQLIAQHQANLLQVVRASGEWLTAEEDIKRGRGELHCDVALLYGRHCTRSRRLTPFRLPVSASPPMFSHRSARPYHRQMSKRSCHKTGR